MLVAPIAAILATFLPAPVATHHAESEPHQRAEERHHDGVEPQRPREAQPQEVEPDVFGVLDDEDDQDADAGERRDRSAAQLAPAAPRWLLAHDAASDSGRPSS
jgi:hypothetical protein